MKDKFSQSLSLEMKEAKHESTLFQNNLDTFQFLEIFFHHDKRKSHPLSLDEMNDVDTFKFYSDFDTMHFLSF